MSDLDHTVSIVVPMRDKWGLTHQTLYDIMTYMNSVDEIIVVNDGSTDREVYDGLRWWKNTFKKFPLKVLDMEENVGFLRASNAGLHKASQEIVILLSNDVRVQTDIISHMSDILDANPKTLIGGKLYNNDTGWNKFGKKIFCYLEGWLLATTKENWKELGYLDDRFAPSDFEDIDLTTTALSMGYDLMALEDMSIYHKGGGTLGYNPEREAITKRNQKKFAEKWMKS